MSAEQLVKSRTRQSTSKVYSSSQKLFIEFCKKFSLNFMPATEETLLLYIAHLHENRLSAGSMHVYMLSIRSMHVRGQV